MGCTQSKVIEATDVYRPAPTSFALFDISTVEEPWVITKSDNNNNDELQQQQEKVVHVPATILEKLDKFEIAADGPHSWSEVSKALEDLKPTLHTPLPKPQPPQPKASPPARTKSLPFHTLEELDTKSQPLPSTPVQQQGKSLEPDTKSQPPRLKTPLVQRSKSLAFPTESLKKPELDSSQGFKPIKENIFILQDRLEREREGNLSSLEKRLGIKLRRDPLRDYLEKCPPGGSDSVVLYTTTLRGVRRTFEDCNRARSIIDLHRVVIDERDVSLHGKFLNELRELLGEDGEATVPRLFIKGRYIGGVDQVVELNETSRLSELLNAVGKNWEGWGSVCEGCGGARFVPCLECGGSCKVLIGNSKERCDKCNENGLIQCPVCH